MFDVKTYHEYVTELDENLKKWIITKDSLKSEFTKEITYLPLLLHTCIDIISTKDISKEIKNKAIGAIEYAKNDFDHLSEAILGNRGLIDDLFIAALVVIESSKSGLEINKHTIDISNHIINISKKMLGDNLYNKCFFTYKKL